MKPTSHFASIAAAAAAGAMFMYYVDAKRRQPARASASRRPAPGDTARTGSPGAPEVVEHPTAAARSSWNEQGV